MATSAVELERLVVRLVGEGKGYEKVLNVAVAKTAKAGRKIGAITETQMAAQNSAMEEAARITHAVATPTERYAKELKNLKRLYKSGQLGQKDYTRALKKATSALPSVQKAQAKYNQEIKRANEITREAARPVDRYKMKLAEVNALHKKGMVSAATHTRTIRSLNKEFQRGAYALTSYGRKIESVGRGIRDVGMKASLYLTTPLSIASTIAVHSFGSVDSAITKSAAIMSGMSDDLRRELTETARTMSLHTETSAKDLAASYFYLASAGMTARQSIAALPVVEEFAVAGTFDMARATDLLTDAQSALGLSSKDVNKNMTGLLKVSDTLVKANTLANATVEQFSEALTHEAGPAIKQYNMDLEEGVAILAAYADQGLKGNVAGSMMGRMTRLLIRSINDNGEVFKRLNIDVEEFATTGKNITGIIKGITRAVKGMGPAQKAATLETLGFEARIQQAILPLLGLTDRIYGYRDALRLAGGTTKRIAEFQLTSFNNQLKMVWNNVKDVAYEIGHVLEPYILMLGHKVKDLTNWWRGLAAANKKVIVIIGTMVAMLGPALMIMGALVIMVGKATIAVGLLNVGLGFLGLTFKGLMVKMMLISLVTMKWVIRLGAVAMALLYIAEGIGIVNLGFTKMMSSIRIGGVKIGSIIDMVAVGIHRAWNWMVKASLGAWAVLWGGIKELGAMIWRLFLRVADGVVGAFWWLAEKAVKAATWLARQMVSVLNWIGVMSDASEKRTIASIERVEKAVEEHGKSAAKKYENAINKSLDNSEKRWHKHQRYIKGLDMKYRRDNEVLDQVMKDIVTDEVESTQKDQGKIIKKQRDMEKELAALTGDALKGFELGDIELPEIELPEIEVEIPDVKVPEPGGEKQFKVTSLRRFSFDPLPGQTPPTATGDRKLSSDPVSASQATMVREVRDAAVVERLDVLIELVRSNPSTAALAR